MPTMAAVKIDGTKLKSLREQRFLSREELAEKVDSHRDHIGRLERGEVANPRMATIRNLAKALGVDPAELVEDSG
jgi:transcriptional regulator with XRE-family HTH domain